MSLPAPKTNVLIFARLLASGSPVMYGSGLEGWAKSNLPNVNLLDLDSESDKGFAGYIFNHLQEAKKAVLWVKADEAQAGLGTIAPLLEFVIRNQKKCLLVLDGRHLRIEKLSEVAGTIFMSASDENIKKRIEEFFERTPTEA